MGLGLFRVWVGLGCSLQLFSNSLVLGFRV